MTDYKGLIERLRDKAEVFNDFSQAKLYREAADAIEELLQRVEVVRCKDCLVHGVCRFEQGLGLDGYCSQSEWKPLPEPYKGEEKG